MFDDLFLLANGDLTYSGPVSDVPKWFKTMVTNLNSYNYFNVNSSLILLQGLPMPQIYESGRPRNEGDVPRRRRTRRTVPGAS